MSSPEVSLRPCVDADLAFLSALYAHTRSAEMAQLGWPAAAVEAFVAQQFAAQQQHYQSHYGDAQQMIIEAAGEPVGRAYLHWSAAQLHIIDISLLPAWQGQGIGTRLLGQWLARADASGLFVSLQVLAGNPAQRLYLRHGFQASADDGLYLHMQRQPLLSAA
ncbi:GNAT family N-acetyltransferase [Pseudomonas plecoglossicida]|uniref:GNAT family N-acetyltransferase n=1 Tax=Pseudomonas plecoglossicida TaxID=70775 RepID=UPI0015E445D5|nr:GNAT family N-acetyltransferase [Pseudomonas plecoglossicida]MBA1322731.1 GNAT family N-acetyltransferase [Pseudomonas plecoglossicida]